MSGWAGFTDAELQRMKGSTGVRPGTRKPSTFTKPKSSQQRMLPQQNKGDHSVNLSQPGVIPPAQMLSKPTVPSNNNTIPLKPEEKLIQNVPPIKTSNLPETQLNYKEDNNGNVENAAGQNSTEVKEVQELELNQSEVLSHQMSKLEKYQQQQKQIEELNKQRKNLLAKAISERSKKAKAEATKLKHIEKELGHLDQLLTNGVTIIRDRIEQASIAYLEAQHRYERAEREFIEAKIYLHEKAEMKEQLTEHLYTIIHQNEIRKSEKLAQLMKELEMETAVEDIEVKVDLPPLSSFNIMPTLSPTKVLRSPTFPTTGGLGTESKMADNSAKSHQDSQPQSDSYPQPIKSTEESEADSQPIKNLEQSNSDRLSADKAQVSQQTKQTFSDQEKDISTLPKPTQEHESHAQSPLSNLHGEGDAPVSSLGATNGQTQQQGLSNQ
ncbi:RAB6-interacting golgin-like [Liolophura sinensis]|uniref:RAB6-interacting golgin-like n=1 Tax=Liolophura sinensis TaxID=3198878 RepID=UPI003159042D